MTYEQLTRVFALLSAGDVPGAVCELAAFDRRQLATIATRARDMADLAEQLRATPGRRPIRCGHRP